MQFPPQRAQGNRQQTHLLMEVQSNFSDIDPAYPLFNVTHTSTKLFIFSDSRVEPGSVDMEVDIGVFFSLISKDTYNKLWPNLTTAPPLQKSVILLRTYTGRCCRLCFCRCQIQGTYFSPPPDHGCWQRPKFTWPRLVKAHQIRLESLTSSGDTHTYWIIIMLYFAITLAL